MLRETFVGLALVTLTASAATAQTPSIDELISLTSPGDVAISPDGRTVAYTVTETNWDADRYEREIWLAREGETPFQLTRAARSSYSPEWSPDGQTLAFLSDRTEKTQIYRIHPSGGEAEELTDPEVIEEGVARFQWARDGSFIAFTALDPESEASKERKKTFGEFHWEDEDPRMTQLYRLDLASLETKRLTEGQERTVDDFAVSPDGKRIVFSARPFPSPAAFLLSDLYLLDLSDGSVRAIVDWPGADGNPRWSPTGDRIAFETGGGVASYYENGEIGIVSPNGGPVEIVSESFDEDKHLIDWREEGLYFTATARTERHLYHMTLAGRVDRLSEDGWVLGSVSLATKAPRLAVTADRFDRFTEVYTSPLAPMSLRRVTDFDRQLSSFALGKREVVRWKSTDGTTIEGVLVKPQDFDPSRKYPLLFKIHGGPTGVDLKQKLTSSDRRYYPIEAFVARGALVLMVNYRGSSGYGEAFRSLNVRNLGLGDAWDVVSGLDHFVKQGFVDETRVGTMGWSQGGYISAFLATHDSARFQAASVGAGISDWMTYYVNTDIHPFTRQYLKATPWDDREIYDETSPITYINRAATPTLIQHGEKDARVPIPNAYELYQGLRDRNVPVRLAVYHGFGHGIDKPKSNRAVMTHNEEWFGRWIWEEKTETSGPQ